MNLFFFLIYDNATLYLTGGGAIGHSKSHFTKPWNKECKLRIFLHLPAGMFVLMNRCHSYGRTRAVGSEVISSPQSHPDNIGRGRFCSSGKIFRVCGFHLPHMTSPPTLSRTTHVSPFSPLDRFQDFCNPLSSGVLFLLINVLLWLNKIKTSGDKLHSSVLRCDHVPAAHELSWWLHWRRINKVELNCST